MQLVIGILQFVAKAVDKWVLGGAEAPPNFWHFYVKRIAHSTQHTTVYDMQGWRSRSGGPGNHRTNGDDVADNTLLTNTDLCRHKLRGLSIKENSGDLRTSILWAL